tara:strand:+ start:3815 stop:4969 length:1155 start_codon:yes stop_codon:yes gene_type:complete
MSVAITFANLNSMIPTLLSGDQDDLYSVLIRGRHGIGKSWIAYQTASGLAWDATVNKTRPIQEGETCLPVVEIRASQMTEGDLLGLPSPHDVNVNGEQAASLRPFAWLVKACTEPVVLFLDEVDRATTEVRQGFFQLGDSRQINGWKLHPGTVVFGAVNGGVHAAQYQVADMDPAELDRWVTFDVEPSTEDWLDWGKNEVHAIVWDFINQNREHLEHKGEFEPGTVYPSRRSWHRLSNTFAKINMLDEESADMGLLFNLSHGFVGFEAAVALRDFVENYERQVTIEDILDHGKLDKTKDFGLVDHVALIEKMDAAGIFTASIGDTRLLNMVNYFDTLPSEARMKLFTTLTAQNSQISAENGSNFHKMLAKQGKVEAFIKLLGGK